MTHPTEQSIRERLERAVFEKMWGAGKDFSNRHLSWETRAEWQDDICRTVVAAILAEQAAIRAEQREADRRSTEQRVLDDLGQSQPDWAKDALDGGK